MRSYKQEDEVADLPIYHGKKRLRTHKPDKSSFDTFRICETLRMTFLLPWKRPLRRFRMEFDISPKRRIVYFVRNSDKSLQKSCSAILLFGHLRHIFSRRYCNLTHGM